MPRIDDAIKEVAVGSCRLFHGEALEVLRTLPDNSIDSLCADPPAGIAFMGKEWDNFTGVKSWRDSEKDKEEDRGKCGKTIQPFGYSPGYARTDDTRSLGKVRCAFIAFLSTAMHACLRVTKPGGYALVWALPRTSHWTATAIEDAGWEIRDRISHLFGQGFPKGQTCLKPAVEDWWLCRKPGKGVRALNIDGCRIGTEVRYEAYTSLAPCHGNRLGAAGTQEARRGTQGGPKEYVGRWPANLVLSHALGCVCVGRRRVKSGNAKEDRRPFGADNSVPFLPCQPHNGVHYGDADGMEEIEDWQCVESCPVRLLDEQSGTLDTHAGKAASKHKAGIFGVETQPGRVLSLGDTGGASRFFYCPKAARSERYFYCADCAKSFHPDERDAHQHGHVDEHGRPDNRHITMHPTQKSEELMRWLCRLITPPGGVVLDCFMGSGSTGKAAIEEGFRFIGIERDANYFAIAEQRLREVVDVVPRTLFDEETEIPATRSSRMAGMKG